MADSSTAYGVEMTNAAALAQTTAPTARARVRRTCGAVHASIGITIAKIPLYFVAVAKPAALARTNRRAAGRR